MDVSRAVGLFRNNWFLRNATQVELSEAEQRFIGATLGLEPQRWDGAPDIERMAAMLADEPGILERIGAHLLQVAVAMRGCGDAVAFLLDRGVPLELDRARYNVLHEAAWADARDTLTAVFERGAVDATAVAVKKPHAGWPDNLPLMYWAAWGGYPELAKLLLKYGARVHHELDMKGNGERGTTSLHEAVAPGPWPADNKLRSNAGKLAVADILVADGASYDVYAAAARNDTDRLEAIVQRSPQAASTPDGYGMTPLHWAARAGALAAARLLLARGADPNARNKTLRSPLQLAAEHDQAAIIGMLAWHDVDLDSQDKKGRTPLHRATYGGQLAAAEALLAAGADPTVRNKAGKTAFEIARQGAKALRQQA